MAFAFHISCMKWSVVTGLEGGKKSKDSGQQVLSGKWKKTPGQDTGNIRHNGFKLRIIKWGLVYDVMRGDNYSLMAFQFNM